MKRAPPGTDKGVAVITQNGVILLGRGYFLLADGFFLFVMSLAAYIYFTMKPVVKDRRIKRAQYLWVISAVFADIRPILLLGHLFFLWTSLYIINIIFNLFTAITIAYVTLVYPESVVLSHAQIVRASNLYQRIQTFSSDFQVREFGMASLVDYIQKIPSDILTVLIKETNDLS